MTGGTQTKSQFLPGREMELQDPILDQGDSPLFPCLHVKWQLLLFKRLLSEQQPFPTAVVGYPQSWGESSQKSNLFHRASPKGGAHPQQVVGGQNWNMLINNQTTSGQIGTSHRVKRSILHAAADLGGPYVTGSTKEWPRRIALYLHCFLQKYSSPHGIYGIIV